MLLSMAFAEGCGPASEDSSGRRANTRLALVTSVPAQEGQAFLVSALVTGSAESQTLQNALQETGAANHLELDVQPLNGDANAQTALLERRQLRAADGLLICVLNTGDIQPLLRATTDRQIPVVVVQWEPTIPAGVPVTTASAGPVSVSVGSAQMAPMAAQNAAHPLSAEAGKRAALLTLYHNGKSTQQRLTVTPEELGAAAVTTLSAYLRGEKVKAKSLPASVF